MTPRFSTPTLRRVAALCRPFLPQALPVIVAIVIGSALNMVPPYLTGLAINAMLAHNLSSIMSILAIYLATVAAAGLVGFANSYGSARLRENLCRSLRLQLAGALRRATYEHVSNIPIGEISNRVIGDIDALGTTLQYAFFPLFSAVIMLTMTIVAMVALNLTLSLAAFAMLVVLVLPALFASRRIGTLRLKTSQAKDVLEQRAQETFSPQAIALIKATNAAPFEHDRLYDAASTVFDANVATAFVSGQFSLFSTILTSLGPAVVLAVGAHLAVAGNITIGMVVAFLVYQGRLYGPVGALAGLQVQLASIGAICNRIYEVLDAPVEPSGTAAPSPGILAFDRVSLSRNNRTILNDVSFDVARGAHVAIVGASGAGKSTIATLAIALLEPDSGTIRLDGTPLPALDLIELRRTVAVATQDPFLFNESFFYNLAYGNDADDDTMSQALAGVNAAPLEAFLDDERSVGARGARLSGGERQRLALARTLLREPELLILDEATSAVDAQTEKSILASVRTRMEGKTLIVITHRISSIVDFDSVIVLKDGAIAGVGTHSELLAGNAAYCELIHESSVVTA